MPRFADVMVAQTVTGTYTGGATKYTVQTPSGVLYLVYVDSGSDVAFRKSTDNGVSWSNPTIVFAGTAIALSVWYDRWSNISAGLIHCAYTETGGSDTLYRSIDTESSDALGTQTTIHAGTSAVATGSFLSIVRARGGNVYCRTQIDAGAEGAFYRLPNANVPSGAWDAARTINEANATLDQIILVPGFAADNQDIMGIFWDASANEISRQVYDDSANSWAETSIATSMTELTTATAFPMYAATVDLTNSRIIMVAWSAVDTANADLRCWTITESAITETSTNVVLNSTDDQGLCAVTIDADSGDWRVFYCGKSDGSETWLTILNVYMKCSKDQGATWGPETKMTSPQSTYSIRTLIVTPRSQDGRWGLAFYNDQAIDELLFIAPLTQARSVSMLGI